MSKRPYEIAVLVTGLLIFLGGFAHSLLGWPAVSALLSERGIDASVSVGLFMEWNFAAGAMLVLGALVLLLYRDMRRSARADLRTGRLVGGLYAVFGAAGFIYRFPSPHFLAFLVVGATLLGAVAGWDRRRS